jgi:CDP-diacylglycerol--serine O-phosphatidyltransferase
VIARVTRRRRRARLSAPTGPVGKPGGTPVDQSWQPRRATAVVDPVVAVGGLTPTLRPAPDETTAPPAAPIPLLPGPRTPARRAKFALANACTVGSLALGMTAVFLALHDEPRLAALTLLACVVLDGCDGALARRFGVVSPFGAQMDSLADLSSFGVATGLVVYQWLVAEGASPTAAAPACVLVAACAAIRLARFNVSPKDGRYFCGVPTTMVAAVLALHLLLGPELPATVEVAAVVALALSMVTTFPYAKLVRVFRLPLWLWVVPAIGAMISVPGTFAAVVAAYVASGPLLWLFHQRRLTPA